MDSSSNSSPGVGMVLVGIVAGVALGVAVGRLTAPAPATSSGGSTGMLAATTLTDPCHAKGDHTIQVAADGTLDCPDAVIGGQYQVTWITSTGSLKITFRQPELFPKNTCNGTTNSCVSGYPVITWNPGETQRNCDYTGTLSTSTSTTPIAGRIIIVKP